MDWRLLGRDPADADVEMEVIQRWEDGSRVFISAAFALSSRILLSFSFLAVSVSIPQSISLQPCLEHLPSPP